MLKTQNNYSTNIIEDYNFLLALAMKNIGSETHHTLTRVIDIDNRLREKLKDNFKHEIQLLADSIIPCGDRCDGTDDPTITETKCDACRKHLMVEFGEAVVGLL